MKNKQVPHTRHCDALLFFRTVVRDQGPPGSLRVAIYAQQLRRRTAAMAARWSSESVVAEHRELQVFVA